MRKIRVIAILVSLVSVGNAQESSPLTKSDKDAIQLLEDTLTVYARGILNAELVESRMMACHDFIPKLVTALKTPNSFQYHFPRLENISILYPADSTFRIFSWQLKNNDGDYKYFGAIQWNQVNLKLVSLADRSNSPESQNAVVGGDKWYGVVYYNILPFKDNENAKSYLLFGYDAYDVNDHRKVIDVLSFKDGQASFGKPVFIFDKGVSKNRILYEYSADAGVRVNYDEKEQMIICDHLQEIQGLLPGQGKTKVPDGSYEGFKLEKGKWKYIPNVFDSGNSKNQRAFTTKENTSPTDSLQHVKNKKKVKVD